MGRRFQMLMAVTILLATGLFGSESVVAGDDLPRTFGECVMDGGDILSDGSEVTCRLIRSYDFRVYGSGTTECGEVIDIEIWGETFKGVVTYPFAPSRTVELPEVGAEGMVLPEEPLECLGD